VQNRPEKRDGLLHEQRRARRPQTTARLRRSRRDRVLLGVLGGVAEFTGLPPLWLRVGYGLSVAVSAGVTLAAYPVLWLLLPGPAPDEAAGT
jgi:phage shock protein PspC (stress-responsive transcriptional regulator)